MNPFVMYKLSTSKNHQGFLFSEVNFTSLLVTWQILEEAVFWGKASTRWPSFSFNVGEFTLQQ